MRAALATGGTAARAARGPAASRLAAARGAASAAAASGSAATEGYFPAGLGRLTRDVVVESGEGCWLNAEGGRRVLDFTAGIGVVSLGHSHPAVVAAVREQAGRLMHGQLSCVAHRRVLDVVDRLRPLTAQFGIDSFAFANSGAEAVEVAVRVAKYATGRPGVIVLRGGFHGRTIGAASLTTAKSVYRAGIQPLVSGVAVAPYPYCHRCPTGRKPCGGCCGQPEAELELLIKQQMHPGDVAAIIYEPVLGEGGYVPAPPEYARALRRVADSTGALLIADEVQTGFGRTGTCFFSEQLGVRPDLLVMAKGMAGGMPLSAVGGSAAVMDAAPYGALGGTYGGNAVACAASVAVLDELADGSVYRNVLERGEEVRGALLDLQRRHGPGLVADVRGPGLMKAVEFGPDAPAGTAAAVSAAAGEEDMLVLTAGVHETLRLIPPLTVTSAETAEGMARLTRAVDRVLARK